MVKNTTTFEASVGARVLLEQLRQLENTTPAAALEGKQTPSMSIGAALGASSAQVAAKARCGGLLVGSGDIVFWHGHACMVRACAETPGAALFVLVELMEKVSARSANSTFRLKVRMWGGETLVPKLQTTNGGRSSCHHSQGRSPCHRLQGRRGDVAGVRLDAADRRHVLGAACGVSFRGPQRPFQRAATLEKQSLAQPLGDGAAKISRSDVGSLEVFRRAMLDRLAPLSNLALPLTKLAPAALTYLACTEIELQLGVFEL